MKDEFIFLVLCQMSFFSSLGKNIHNTESFLNNHTMYSISDQFRSPYLYASYICLLCNANKGGTQI